MYQFENFCLKGRHAEIKQISFSSFEGQMENIPNSLKPVFRPFVCPSIRLFVRLSVRPSAGVCSRELAWWTGVFFK